MTAAAVQRSKGMFWAMLPVGLLGAALVGLVSMAVIATRDPGFSLERDYYERAVHWEQQQAQWQENARLGYHLALDAAAPAALVVHVRDRDGRSVHGASVRAEAFANARASRVRQLTFQEVADGSYRAGLASSHPGLWEFRFEVQHVGQRFTEVIRTEIELGAAGR